MSITRRQFLPLPLIVGAAAFAACRGSRESQPGSVAVPEDVADYFPSLAGEKLVASGTILTPKSTTNWYQYGFKDATLNEEAVQTSIQFCEDTVPDLVTGETFIADRVYELKAYALGTSKRILYLIPSYVAGPAWGGGNIVSRYGAKKVF